MMVLVLLKKWIVVENLWEKIYAANGIDCLFAYAIGKTIVLQNLPQGTKVEVYNLQAKRVYSTTNHSSLVTGLIIPIQTKGMYFIKVSFGSEKKTLRVPMM
jgi:hypothetical protein